MISRWNSSLIDTHEITYEGRMQLRPSGKARLCDRRIRSNPLFDLLLVASIYSFIFITLNHVVVLLFATAITMFLFSLRMRSDESKLQEAGLCNLKVSEIFLGPRKREVEFEGAGPQTLLLGLELKQPPRLAGNLSKLIRALDTSSGFSFTVSLVPENNAVIVNRNKLKRFPLPFFSRRFHRAPSDIIISKGGLWKTGLTILGQTLNENETRYFDSAVRGSIPEHGLKRMSGKRLAKWVNECRILDGTPRFYALGRELSEWTIQLVSELAPEVGANIPGEFISPVRAKQCDYQLGVIINPETLQTGPIVGFTDDDLLNGVLITGGEWSDRFHAYSLLIPQILRSGKHVIILTNNRRAMSLLSLTNNSLGLTLGKDFVLNPVDAENIPRHEFVPRLKTALEVICSSALSSASHFEDALSRAVALNGGTVADITLLHNEDQPTITADDSPSRASLDGFEAVRVLHRGIGARAFYGIQTAKMAKLTEFPLTVMLIDLNSNELDTFAWDLFMIKISALTKDKNVVIILDEPLNLLLKLHDRSRGLWTHRLITDMLRRGPLMLSIRNPSELQHLLDLFSSCLAFRLKSSQDIKVMSDMLGLSVVDSIHSKARISSRESSYLRTMKKEHALLVDSNPDTCVPLKLGPPLKLHTPSESDITSRRLSMIGTSEQPSMAAESGVLAFVTGERSNLAAQVLQLLERYEPLTVEALKKFIQTSGVEIDDIESLLIQLEQANMILRGHEFLNGVNYSNYRITLKGTMALRQALTVEGGV